MLAGTNYIKLTPTEDIQLILGTNGSGKSSLLDEITPLPSSANDYIKEGFSVKTISHNGHLFILKSTFQPSQKHSFLKDDVELNQGGTVSVQKELVKQEFGITNEIHELIIGRDKFTKMSPAQRRYWFTQLSSVNYDYPISVFNKLRERLRDTSGAIKLNKNRLVAEIAKSISEAEEIELRKEVEEIHTFLNHILEHRKPLDFNIDELNRLRAEVENNIVSYSKTLLGKINKARADYSFGNSEHVSELLLYNQSKEQVLVLQLDDLHTELSNVSKSVSILEETGNKGVEELKESISKLQIEQRDLRLSKEVFKDTHESPVEAVRALEAVTDTLTSVCVQIPSNADKRFSKINKDSIVKNVFDYKNKITTLDFKIDKLADKKRHLESHKNTPELICPKCAHSWKIGYDDIQFVLLNKELDQLIEDKATISKKLDQAVLDNEELDNYFILYRRYQDIVNSWSILSPFWNYINSNDYLLNNPKQILTDLSIFKSDLLIDRRCEVYDTDIKRIVDLITAKQKIDEDDIDKLRFNLKKTEEVIYSKNKELTEIRLFISRISSYKRNLEDIENIKNKLSELESSYYSNKTNSIESLRRQYLNDAIRKVQSILSRKEELLSDVLNQKNITDNINANIQKLEIEEKCLKVIVSELSPTDGLIAEGLFGFIKVFTSNINSFIKNIWTYPFTVQACNLSEDTKVELDYKFPMVVGDEELPVSDVSKGSTGMQEIVNLAFKVTAIKHLGLTEIPLFLDEFGAALDHAHRTTVYGIFDYLINQINFSQVFMVNHYSDLYGSLKNAEICVLHDSNIVIPKDSIYNKHVVIA